MRCTVAKQRKKFRLMSHAAMSFHDLDFLIEPAKERLFLAADVLHESLSDAVNLLRLSTIDS